MPRMSSSVMTAKLQKWLGVQTKTRAARTNAINGFAEVTANHPAKAAQLRLNPVRLSLTLGTAPGGVKAALALLGMSLGPCRSPIAPLSSEKQQKARAVLEQVGLVPAARR